MRLDYYKMKKKKGQKYSHFFLWCILVRFYPNVSFTLLSVIIINNMEYFSGLFTETL